MRWIYYSVAAVATVLAGWLWLFVFAGVSGSASSVSRAPVSAVRVPARLVPPAVSAPVSSACVAGTVWLYDAARQRWFKPSPIVSCDVTRAP